MKKINFNYAKLEEVLPIIIKAYVETKTRKVEYDESLNKLSFFSNFEGSIEKAIEYLIENHYKGGRIRLHVLESVLRKCAYLKDLVNTKFDKIKNVICESESNTLFAVGKLTEDRKDCNSDPYETAGGYINYLAPKGTIVEWHYENGSVYCEYQTSVLVEHYNNNIHGMSTGGGTTKYKIGENEESKVYQCNSAGYITHTEGADLKFKTKMIKVDIKKFQAALLADYPTLKMLLKN